MAHDVFICHASEDKEEVARPLAEALLNQNVDVWYDEFSLSVGDSLRAAIDRGLESSRFAIVIVSPNFFAKPWTNRELAGIVAREMTRRERLLLPVWHKVDVNDVLKFSPPLADIRAVNSSIGIDRVVSVLLQSIHPDEQPLPIARTELQRFGWEPPPFSDEWWLDKVTLANDIAYGMYSHAFQFPPCHRDEQTSRERGENIAWAALQSGWWDEAEGRKICQISPPEVVFDFISGIPELHEACRLQPAHFASYVPQLLIPQFSGEFTKQFDELLAQSERAFAQRVYPSPSDEHTLCDARLALRHPTLGNHSPSRIVDKWLRGHKGAYSAELLSRIDYLFWLLSDDSLWLPLHIRQTLLQGMHDTPHWWFDATQLNLPKKLQRALYARRRTKLKWTKALLSDLAAVAEESRQRIILRNNAEQLAERFVEHDLIGGMDQWHQRVEESQRRRS